MPRGNPAALAAYRAERRSYELSSIVSKKYQKKQHGLPADLSILPRRERYEAEVLLASLPQNAVLMRGTGNEAQLSRGRSSTEHVGVSGRDKGRSHRPEDRARRAVTDAPRVHMQQHANGCATHAQRPSARRQ